MANVSNPATLTSVITVFEGPAALSAYVNGGSYVYSTTGHDGISTTVIGLALSEFSGVVGNPTCVVQRSYMLDGDKAGQYGKGRSLLVTDPYSPLDSNTCVGTVVASIACFTQCVRIIAEDGTWLECSRTALIPTKSLGYVQAPYLQGLSVPTIDVEQIEGNGTSFGWSKIVEVRDIGYDIVQSMYIEDRCFWASGDGKRFMLHHNAKPPTPL